MEAISEVQAELCAINARIEEVTRKLSDLQPIQENRRGVDFSKIQTMESMVQEILTVSRMKSSKVGLKKESIPF